MLLRFVVSGRRGVGWGGTLQEGHLLLQSSQLSLEVVGTTGRLRLQCSVRPALLLCRLQLPLQRRRSRRRSLRLRGTPSLLRSLQALSCHRSGTKYHFIGRIIATR